VSSRVGGRSVGVPRRPVLGWEAAATIATASSPLSSPSSPLSSSSAAAATTSASGDGAGATSLRTHTCGELRARDAGQHVTVAGWMQRPRSFGEVLFVPLRDRYGTVQLLVPPTSPDHEAGRDSDAELISPREALAGLTVESVVSVEGWVRVRPPDMVNPHMATGEVEVEAVRVRVLNEAARGLPFTSATKKVGEEQRLRYRYLDLRRPTLQRNLIVRSRIVAAMRHWLIERGFLEVETPTLFKSTPEVGCFLVRVLVLLAGIPGWDLGTKELGSSPRDRPAQASAFVS
jgi:lysyl-tRNA synthetase class II